MDIEKVKEKYGYLKEKYDYVVAEGSGGIICPLIDNGDKLYHLEDLIKDLKMNVIVVAKGRSWDYKPYSFDSKNIYKNLGIKVKGLIIQRI